MLFPESNATASEPLAQQFAPTSSSCPLARRNSKSAGSALAKKKPKEALPVRKNLRSKTALQKAAPGTVCTPVVPGGGAGRGSPLALPVFLQPGTAPAHLLPGAGSPNAAPLQQQARALSAGCRV